MALAKHIETGKAYAGLLSDGVGGTPYVVATLTLTAETGLLVEVPYSTTNDTDQFTSAQSWFESAHLPTAFQFRGDELEVALYGCRMSGRTRHFGRQLAVGRFLAENAVLGKRALAEPFDVTTIRSRMDGLREWTGFTATEIEHHTDEYSIIHALTIHVESRSKISWSQDDATMLISTDWAGKQPTSSAGVDEWVTLSSTFDPPQPPGVHISAQKIVRDLLILNFGTALSFRQHAVQDSSMPSPPVHENAPIHLPFRELLHRDTTWDHFQPVVEESALSRPIGYAGDYPAQTFEAWPEMHARWSRAVRPLVSLLTRSWFTAEDVLLASNISLEATGHLLEPVAGEEITYRDSGKPNPKIVTASTYVLRSLRALPVDWSQFHLTETGLARLVAKTYNSIKHYSERPYLEDDTHLRVVADISQIVARLALLAQLPGTHDVISTYCSDYPFSNVLRGFERLHVTVTDDGVVEPRSTNVDTDD